MNHNLEEVTLFESGAAAPAFLFAMVEGAPKLSTLTLYHCDMAGTGYAHISAMSSLASLSLVEVPLDVSGCEQLAKLKSLTVLGLSETNLDDAVLSVIGDRMPQLTQLLTDCADITDAGVKHIAKLRQLRTLDLSGADRITTVGIEALSMNLGQLTHLDLSACPTVNEPTCMTHLSNIPSLTLLKCSHLSSEAASGLRELPGRLTALRSLFITDSPGVGLEAIRHICELTGLRQLNLHGCEQVDTAGVECIAAMPCLTRVSVGSCGPIDTDTLKARFSAVKLRPNRAVEDLLTSLTTHT